MTKSKWKKAYKGPFSKTKATEIYKDIKLLIDNGKSEIEEVAMRKRGGRRKKCVCTAACGAGLGHNTKYDVYIKTQSTEKCYLEYVEGHLTCTYNHTIGDECLMQQKDI